MDEVMERPRRCGVIPPLSGHTIALTGDRRVGELSAHFEALGAMTVIGPMLRTRPDRDDRGQLWAATAAVIACPPDYLLATTAIGMRSWFDAAATWGLRDDLVDALRSTKILARGPKVVGALAAADLPIWMADRTGSTDQVIDALAAHRLDGTRVAIQVPGREGGKALRRITNLGANTVAIEAYDLTWPDELAPATRLIRAVAERRVSAVTFTSSAAVKNFVELSKNEKAIANVVDALADGVMPMCVGRVTARVFAESTGTFSAHPAQPTLGALVEALAGALRRRDHRHLTGRRGPDVVVQGRLVDDGGRSVLMSDREAAVLRRLMLSAGRVVSGDTLLRAVWAGEPVEPAVLETTMTRLRRRLRDTGVVIETVRRRGYVLVSDVERCDSNDPVVASNLSAPVPA